jgi:hypothetical protein
MDLFNHTRFPSILTRFGASIDTMGSALVVRATYDIVQGRLVPSDEQSWAVSPKPWQCEYGPMEADDAFHKAGTDLFVFGRACSPGGRPTTQMKVSIEVGAFRRDVTVFGDRAWLPGGKQPKASAPRPFVEMPLTMSNAYGGSSEWDGLKVPFADNQLGKGFVLEVEQAPGVRLPNIEDPQKCIVRWDDRPAPVGLGICPPTFSGRLAAGITFGDNGAMKRIHPRLFNAAYPEMIAADVGPGTLVRLSGVSPNGVVAFSLPATPVVFRLTMDRTVMERVPTIDQVGIEVDKKRVFITYRHPFRYALYEGQQRRADLLAAHGS